MYSVDGAGYRLMQDAYGGKLTVQTNNFSHNEGNGNLGLLYPAMFVLRDKREQIGMVVGRGRWCTQ